MDQHFCIHRPARALFAFGVACILGTVILQAQPARIDFRHPAQDDVRRSNRITAVLQDRKGFLWIGMDDGLFRYDGFSFLPFTHHAEDPRSLAEGAVTCLYEDRAGRLWIGTDSGLCRKGVSSDDFDRFRNEPSNPNSPTDSRISSLFEDDRGTLWIGTHNGLNAFDRSRRSFTRFQNNPGDPGSLIGDDISDIVQTPDGTIWIGTTSGLAAFDRESRRFTRFVHQPGNAASLANDKVYALALDNSGVLWVGTNGGILHRFARENASFRAVLFSAQLRPKQKVVEDITISSIFTDESGKMWIGTQSGMFETEASGLYSFDPATGAIAHYRHDAANPNSLSGDDVTAIIGDRSGMVWVGTGSGLNCFQNKAVLFASMKPGLERPLEPNANSISGMCEDANGTVWIGTSDGWLNAWNKASGKIDRIDINEDPNARTAINAIVSSADGNIWVGTAGAGLVVIDPATKKVLHRYRHTGEGSLSNDVVLSVIEASDRTLWLGTSGDGVCALDPERATFRRYKNDPAKPNSFGGDIAQCLIEDASGSIWAGTYQGILNKFDRNSGTWTRLTVSKPGERGTSQGTSINCLYQDARKNLWIGTSDGLYLLLPDGVNFNVFTKADGLPEKIVTSILGDDDGNLWVATYGGGLCRFSPRTLQPGLRQGGNSGAAIKVFATDDGLQGLDYTQRACFRARDGSLMFGGTGGLNAFTPETINRRLRPPSVRITDFQVNDRSITPGDKSGILTVPIEDTRELVLPYGQDRLTFEFAVLHFSNVDKNTYQYKLEGADWKDSTWKRGDGQKRYATYTNLPDGEYTFRVRGATSDGIWNDDGVVIHLRITPPWYRTAAAYISYALLLILLVYATDRGLRSRIVRKERREAEIREAELRVQTVAAQAEASEAKARALEIENERQELELAKAHELGKAYEELDEAHRNLMDTQAQLIHAEKMASLGQLTAGIAHEIKNPLNFVNNFAELTIGLTQDFREELETEETKTYEQLRESIAFLLEDLDLNARKIAEHGKRADGIVRSMLAHSSGKTGERQATDINNLVEEYVNLAWHSAKANHSDFALQVDRRYDPAVGTLPVLSQELARVILNLLNNAIDALRERSIAAGIAFKPVLTVSTENRPREVAIIIADNGTGIPEEIREKIFQPFFTTKPTGAGTGLGLSISYDIVVNGHHGQMLVDSIQGEGTTFSILLPRE